MKTLLSKYKLGLGCLMVFAPGLASAATTTNHSLQDLLKNVGSSVNSLEDILLVCLTLIGASFLAFGLLHLKKHGEMGYQAEHNKKGLYNIGIGAALLLLPLLMQMLAGSLGGKNSQSGADHLQTYQQAWTAAGNGGSNPS